MQHPNLFHTTVIQAKQEKSTFKKIKQQIHAENCKQECVGLTLAQPSAHLSTPIAMVTELGWLALGAQCRRVFSIFSSRWNFHSPLIFALRRDDPSEGCGAMCSRVCIVGKGHHPDDRRRQLACDIWPRRFCQCDTRAFLLTTFSVLIQFCFLLLFCRIIRFSSVCFGFFRLLCFLHFWLNYCKKNKHCQTGSDTLQPFVPIG